MASAYQCSPFAWPRLQVVFIEAGSTLHDIAEYASKCPLLYVRGDEVFKWALMLAHHYKGFAGLPVSIDQGIMQSYRGMHGVPASLVRTAVVARSEEEVEELHTAHLLPRVGYAATRFGATEDPGKTWGLLTCSIAKLRRGHINMSCSIVQAT